MLRKLVISITIVTCPLHYVNFMGYSFFVSYTRLQAFFFLFLFISRSLFCSRSLVLDLVPSLSLFLAIFRSFFRAISRFLSLLLFGFLYFTRAVPFLSSPTLSVARSLCIRCCLLPFVLTMTPALSAIAHSPKPWKKSKRRMLK